jgi:signal transduction histidine kinase
MKRTLYLKFILAYALFAFFGFLLVSTLISNLTLEQVKREKAESLYNEATLIANTYATGLYDNRISLDAVQTQIEALDKFMSASIWIINPSGRLVLNSSNPIDVDNEIIIENFDPTITFDSYYTEGYFFDTFSNEMLSVFAPITSNYKVQGYVVIHTTISSLIQIRDRFLNVNYITFAVLFVLSLIILLFFTEIVYIPLRKITYATEAYANGNFRYKLQIDNADEIGYLANSLNYMASEIAKSEDNKKRLVANISHDFRSPLTSIRGYLEAMLDGTIPTKESEKYIKIVLNETNRLTKLTNSLLTLNNLNTKGMILDKKDFELNSIIRDTASSFEGTCKSKRIAIELFLTGENLYVNADTVKIQQVLYNLLDNAIKFSHCNSLIRIETTEKKHRLWVSIKDSGVGIPKESLTHIWDRFYKTDSSRGKDKKGTGLGLSITKEIIHSHGENIHVMSTEGVGTEFTFTLLKSKDLNEEEYEGDELL